MYWAVVYDPGKYQVPIPVTSISLSYIVSFHLAEVNKVNAVNIMSHVLNSALMLIDLIVVGHPIKVQHAYQTIGMGVMYMIFTIIYFLVGGTNR